MMPNCETKSGESRWEPRTTRASPSIAVAITGRLVLASRTLALRCPIKRNWSGLCRGTGIIKCLTGSPGRLRGRVCKITSAGQARFVAVDVGQILWAELTLEAVNELD